MPLYVKDREVSELAERLASIKGTSKTDAVRTALKNELKLASSDRHLSNARDRAEEAMQIAARLRANRKPGGKRADREFIDSLYED